MGLINRRSEQSSPVTPDKSPIPEPQVVGECYCPNGHSLITDLASFNGYQAITVKLKSESQEGVLALSPVVGDKARSFFDFERVPGEIIQICCSTCSEPLPVYNLCSCGADLVVMFMNRKAEFSNCVGICQRIGCLHSEIKSNRDLRLYSRNGYFS